MRVPRASGPLMAFAPLITLFAFLVMIYHRVDDRDKFLYENFVPGKPRFYASSHLKI